MRGGGRATPGGPFFLHPVGKHSNTIVGVLRQAIKIALKASEQRLLCALLQKPRRLLFIG